MISKLSLLLLCGVISTHLGNAQKLPKVKKLNMKVHINITGETLVMKFHRPNEALKLEGFILGYGSNYFSNQYIQWPDNGKPYITDVDAETRYLIAVKPNENPKKNCKDKNSVQKPLQLVIGTMTPTSVYLSWGILINPQVDWSALSKCPNDRFYTVRYREKNKDWNFQLCPSTETVVDNLKPNTMYEFGVKDNTDDALWSKCLNYKTIPKGKENGHIENTYKIPKGTLQYASEDTKALIPVMIVKQGFQNISKSAPAPPPTELSPVFREETKKPPFTTTRPSTPKPKSVSKVTDSPPVTKSPETPVLEDAKPVPGKMEKAVASKSEKNSQRPPTTAVPKPAQTIKMPINLIRIHIFDNEDLPTVTDKTEKAVSSILEKTSQSPPTTSVPKPVQTKKMPINLIRLHIFGDPELPSVTERTEKAVSSIVEKTSQSPPTTAVTKPAQTKKMPINLIRLHIFDGPALPTVESETQTTSPSIPKITQSNKMSEPKLAPKTTQKAPIHLIRLHIFEDPDISTVPNTTLTPSQSSTTLKLQTPNPTPVPTQKVSQQKTQKPKPTPRTRTKPASTARTKDTTAKPQIPYVTAPTTLAPYKVQHSSSRPRTSLRPRTRPVQNGTSQGTIRPRPTGDFNWAPGTIPGGRVLDSTKLLGVSRNISMEPNNTGKKIFSVSATPLPPVRPTSIRRRIPASNVTGRPSVTVSSPPLSPVKPTSIRRKPPINGTSRPATAGGILIPRAPSTARPNCTMVSKKPTIPAPDEDFVDATVFSPSPKSDIDALGQPRYTAPHVKYVSKEDNIPCSITETLKHFPTEEGTNQEALIPPQNPPSNLSVVTVEGCPSFVILDWEQPDNDTVTEYKVISTENGSPTGKDQSITTTNQTYSTVENLKPNTSYEFKVVPKNPLGEGPVSTTVEFNTESADPRVSEPVTGGKDAIWTSIKFKSDSYSECKGKQFVKRTWYKKFVGIQLCNSLRYKIYLSDTLTGTFYNIGDQSGYGEDHCQFVDSFLDGRTGQQLLPEQLTTRKGFYRSVRQQPVEFGEIGGWTHISYVHWYECGIAIPGKW